MNKTTIILEFAVENKFRAILLTTLIRRSWQSPPYTDKKENQIFLICKEIENGAIAKSYNTNGLLIYGELFAHFLIFYRKPLLIYDFATAPL
jgi:hypothetical protein